jgi:hypothetical protein
MVEWKACLQRMIALAERVAIIGVGNSLQGDDGAGQALIALLREHLPVNNTFCCWMGVPRRRT